jgi:hypothetical protein
MDIIEFCNTIGRREAKFQHKDACNSKKKSPWCQIFEQDLGFVTKNSDLQQILQPKSESSDLFSKMHNLTQNARVNGVFVRIVFLFVGRHVKIGRKTITENE